MRTSMTASVVYICVYFALQSLNCQFSCVLWPYVCIFYCALGPTPNALSLGGAAHAALHSNLRADVLRRLPAGALAKAGRRSGWQAVASLGPRALCSVASQQPAASSQSLLSRVSWRRRRRHVDRREAREHVVAHRQVVDRRRDDDGGLLHVVLDHALVRVEIRVVRVRVVLDRVLLESDARQ